MIIDLAFKGCRGRVDAIGRIEDRSRVASAEKEGEETGRLEIRQEPPGIHFLEESRRPWRGAGREFSSFLKKRP